MKDLSPAQTSRLMAMLDETLDMDPPEREAWLARQQVSEPRLTTVLRNLLAAQSSLAKQGFLETLIPFPHAAPALDAQFVGRQFGPYRIVSLLGHGGMGSVWLAERVDGLFSRQVALKLINAARTGSVLKERFSREREILATLNHPNIARLFDAGFADDGQPYLALEYIAGTPLKRYCDERGLCVNARLELFRQVLGAVQYAHASLVIHRDLKPSNILVSDDGQVHLLDFGIAKLLSEGEAKETELTRLGGVAMTPDYAAPEQITGAPVTIGVDIYALGVMLYELLTGDRPYRLTRETRGALEEAILHAEPVPPSRTTPSRHTAEKRGTTVKKLARALHGDLETIVLKSLKMLPAERYPTAVALSEDIDRYLRGDVVLAQRDSFAYRALKYARRHRVGLAAAGLLLLVLLGGLAATLYEARVASKQRDVALESQSRSLTQTAAVRVKDNDFGTGLAIILEVLANQPAGRPYSPESLGVFQDARSADLMVMTIPGHTDRVRSATYSPDGARIVTAAYDRTARIWDATTGRLLVELKGHSDRVRFATFSPDGKLVATSSLDKTARIWDAQTGRQLTQLNGHTDKLRNIAFSPDGRRVVTAASDNTARIWDVSTGAQILLLGGHTNIVSSAAFSPDGRRVVTAAHDNTARVWDAQTGREILRISKHTADLNWGEFSPDGTRIVTASFDKTARVWDAVTGEQIAQMNGHTEQVETAIFSPDGTRVVTSSDDRSARVWDAASGRQLMVLSSHGEQVVYATFSPDGTHIATASDDGAARIWDARQPGEVTVLSGHTQLLADAEYSPDGKLIATGSADKTARIWDAASGRELVKLTGHNDIVLSTEFSPDGKQIATASNDNTAAIWDVATGRMLLHLKDHAQPVESAEFSPDGKHLLTCSYDKTVRIWDAATGSQITVLNGHSAAVNWAAFSPDGARVVSSAFDKTARIWDAATGRQLLVLNGHSASVATANFSPDGRRVVTASFDKTARIWDAATGAELIRLIGHTDRITSAVFSPDGRHIVTSSLDNTARVWDAESGQQLMAARHTDQVETAEYAPDGRHFVTSSADNLAHIWDSRVEPLDTQIHWARAAQFDPLSDTERFQLGLPDNARHWPTNHSKCDESAAAPYDPERRSPGAVLDAIVVDIAIAACTPDKDGAVTDPRMLYQLGRTQMAKGEFSAARKNFEQAVAEGYRAARVDLGLLLTLPAGGMLDLPRAIGLYQDAWDERVTIAAFNLGNMYENRGDTTQAWAWYQKAADAGEPNALARFAQRAEENRNGETDATRLIESFTYYAAAAEKARAEDWPDDSWRNWRYRRAYLARRLAREGKMQEVADSYQKVRKQYGH
jgi:WD40 repeat protein